MADRSKTVEENVPGEFFVDTTCIDCDACRQLAPAVFGDAPSTSRVHSQPRDESTRRAAEHALLACPVGAIGTRTKIDVRAALRDFPLILDNNVYFCGFNSARSYGGNSYFFTHAGGNWLIDSPRFTRNLVHRFTALGGIRYIFLTHRDDVADAAQYAKTFGSERIIHRYERSAQPDAERVLDGEEPITIAP